MMNIWDGSFLWLGIRYNNQALELGVPVVDRHVVVAYGSRTRQAMWYKFGLDTHTVTRTASRLERVAVLVPSFVRISQSVGHG